MNLIKDYKKEIVSLQYIFRIVRVEDGVEYDIDMWNSYETFLEKEKLNKYNILYNTSPLEVKIMYTFSCIKNNNASLFKCYVRKLMTNDWKLWFEYRNNITI